jgi:TnpA family transposase
MEKLQLPKLYKRWNSETHTSSDGQKYNIGVESLNANYSFKYFGKGKGVTVYVFLDEHNRFPYSVVISSSESEAHYVIDGLMHNDVVQSTIHSTDTAGYSEIIFGVCHLIGISFAPRIKNFSDQQLYSFENRSKYTSLGYKILPSGKINIKIIHDNWDDILRFIATIKLRETSASQLFRRLSSYTRQHRLFKALKEFGKIIKTLFLLKYIDDIELRQAIEKQLNKQENSNKLGKAVFHGNNQEFQQSTKEDQMIAEGCKRLIENSIVCWNYLYLSKMIHEAKSIEERNNIIEAVKNGSVLAWQHFNMQGDYDFSDDYLKDAIEFSIDDLLQLKVA